MFIFLRNEKNGSPPPPPNNVAIDQALIEMGKQHCFGGEGEMSNIYNKKWKNSLSVPILLPLIVGTLHYRLVPGGYCLYMGYIGMFGPKGYGFSAVLVINMVSIIALLPPLW